MTQARPAPRLIDLRIDWLVQYSPECNIFGPETNLRALADLPRVDGYLGATSAAFVMLGRSPADWATRADRWRSLDDLVARCEAEFSGRLLMGPDDLARWRDDPDGLTWAVMGVGGLDSLVETSGDLEHLATLFGRGVRVFQPVATRSNLLSHDGGLSDLGRELLRVLDRLRQPDGPRPIVDVAGMDASSLEETLTWYGSDLSRPDRLLLMKSFGPVDAGEIARIRELGGFVSLGASSRSFETLESLKASIPIEHAGIGIATDGFGGGDALPGGRTAPELVAWAVKTFGPEVARGLIRDNASAWIVRMVG